LRHAQGLQRGAVLQQHAAGLVHQQQAAIGAPGGGGQGGGLAGLDLLPAQAVVAERSALPRRP
jgi:hypothetical protein